MFLAVEHSGIYIADGEISNIEVNGFAEGVVNLASASGFTSKSILGRKIYVSSDSNGAVGKDQVGSLAFSRIGERSFYGLVISNCHQFSTECVNSAAKSATKTSELSLEVNETWN